MTKTNKGGFTLIELLVVVAIIGILATVVLASLGTARQRARDAAAKAAMSQVRAEAEIFASGVAGNVYTGVCADTGVVALTTDAGTQTGNTAACDQDASGYAAEVELNDGTFFCVDSSGFAGVLTASGDVTDFACN